MPSESNLTTSVLIASLGRASTLMQCLDSLAAQRQLPDEVIVVWQDDDTVTRDAALSRVATFPTSLEVLHSPPRNIVLAENAALAAARGQIILLIDDDARASADWLEKHLMHYADPKVGAVGGPADNFFEGKRLPIRDREPVGKLTWYGRMIGNMYDHPPSWRERPPREVDHLVGYNLSFRREALEHFEVSLKAYWSLFELDACLQVAQRGYKVLFDFGNVVEHYPTNVHYTHGREGDMTIKFVNPSFNMAHILARRSPASLLVWRWLYQMLLGSLAAPGLLTGILAWWKFGNLRREWKLMWAIFAARREGWREGTQARKRLEAASAVSQGAAVSNLKHDPP
jgi:GT2 family glycosyltransferase